MTKKYHFNNDEWQSDFIYARAPHTKANVKYAPAVDGVLKNAFNPEIGEEDYISLISKKKYGPGTVISTKCAFSGTGAPCLVFTDDMPENEEFPEYGLHFEVCIYAGGVNVWHIIRFPERIGRPIKPTKIYFERWNVNAEGTECTVRFDRGKITVCIEGREFSVEHEDFPENFRVGFTACEGPCAFSEFTVTEAD